MGNIVEHFTLGETEITICDDYCRDKTPEEVDALLQEIVNNTQMYLAKEKTA